MQSVEAEIHNKYISFCYSFSKKKAIIAVVTIAVIGLIINFQSFWIVDYNVGLTSKCTYLPQFHTYGKAGKGYLFLIGYNLIPLFLICICYCALVIMVHQKKKMTSQSNAATEKLTATALSICLCFMILTTPVAIRILLTRLDYWTPKMAAMVDVYDTFAQFMRQMNYAMNFFVYYVSNGQFRRVFKLMLGRAGQILPDGSTIGANNKHGTASTL